MKTGPLFSTLFLLPALGGALLATPAAAAPPAWPARPAVAAPLQPGSPIPPTFRARLRAARFACQRQKQPAACAQLRSLQAERTRYLKAHRAALRQRGLLPPKRTR